MSKHAASKFAYLYTILSYGIDIKRQRRLKEYVAV